MLSRGFNPCRSPEGTDMPYASRSLAILLGIMILSGFVWLL
jgi:hypothetical protein